MEKTPDGTPVGVDDPYEHAGPCDHLTGDGRCRYALEYAGHDPEFAAGRRAEDYECLVGADEEAGWRDCPHYRSTTDGKRCARCGLEEVRIAHDASRPLVEEHHLSYGGSRSRGTRGGAPDGGDGDGHGGGRRRGRARAREGGLDDRTDDRRGDPGAAGVDQPDSHTRQRAAHPDDVDGGVGDGADELVDRDALDDGDPPGDGDRDPPGDVVADDEGASDDDTPSHEITIGLCRWCHAKVHRGFARVDDDANPDPEAIAERESRRGAELGEFGFSTARERRRDK